MSDTYTEAPKTLGDSGQPPETRIGKSEEVQSRVKNLLDADRQGRSSRRALVKGLVDGNPPYRSGDLRAAGRAHACNVNWRTGESYLNAARGAFYDVFSEAPSFATIRTGAGGRKADEWSRIITEEFDWLIRNEDEDFDYESQISQYEMVLYGSGPLMFEDGTDFAAVAVPHRNLLVPEYSLSRPNKWEECAILVDYYAHDLYKKIRFDDHARQIGWDVAAVRKAIMEASEMTAHGGDCAHWEWHQQQLKNNSFNYSAHSNKISCAHYFVREFPKEGEVEGRITHAIVLQEGQYQGEHGIDFLFKKVGRYEKWRHLIHPMYYDNDGGGYHHSVTGLGVKMYSAMEFQNRLICNAADKAFAPKVFFKPTTANGAEVLNVIHMGDYAKVPPGFDAVQIPVGGYIEEMLGFNRELSGMIAANLSQYRQNLSKQTGNPITAREVDQRASEQARLGKTQLNHYYNQLDWFYAEKFRRCATPAPNEHLPGGKAIKEFQERCKNRGVPVSALRQVENVQATRIIGQGSPFMRQQATTELLGTSQLNPSPAGRLNIYKDYVAARSGQAMVSRYCPETLEAPQETDQKVVAALQIAAAKTGAAPIVSQNQDSKVFAMAFTEAAGSALSSLEQGGNPQEIIAFIDLLGPAVQQHIASLSSDPRNGEISKQLKKDWGAIASAVDKITAQLQQQAQQQQQQRAMQARAKAAANGHDPEIQLKAAQLAQDNKRKDAKLAADMRRKDKQVNQKLRIADVTTAVKITNQQREQEAVGAEAE